MQECPTLPARGSYTLRLYRLAPRHGRLGRAELDMERTRVSGRPSAGFMGITARIRSKRPPRIGTEGADQTHSSSSSIGYQNAGDGPRVWLSAGGPSHTRERY
jgi:hypothetical protein